MDSEEYLGWCPVENTLSKRLKDDSLVHTLSSKSQIRKSTKLINQKLKKLHGINTYSQYLRYKKIILEKITENKDVTDESELSDDDYKKFYNSFEITSKDKPKTDVGEEAFTWLYVEKQGRKKTESELDDPHSDNSHPHIWEPSIDISIIENISDPFENPSKSPKQKKVNGLIDKQSKAKSCSPHKSTTKLNIKNVTSASTSKIDNVNIKLTLKKETLAKQSKETQCSKIKKSVNKRPKDVKRNLTSVINDVSRKTPAASEGEDCNDEFVPSDFQAQSTQIFSDTLSDANRGRSVSRLRFSQNEVMNQPRDSGIEEDSREENVSVDKRADKKSEKSVQKDNNEIQENPTSNKNNKGLRNNVNNLEKNNRNIKRHKLSLKIIGEETVTTKYKIISNKDLKPSTEEKKTLKTIITDIKKEDSKGKPQCSSSDSNVEYEDAQNGDGIDNFKQETEETSDEYYDVQNEANGMDSDNENKNNNFKRIKSPAKIDDGKVKKLSEDNHQLFTEESSEESFVSKTFKTKATINNNQNKQVQKIIDNLNEKSDRSTDNENTSDTASVQSAAKSKRNNLSKESKKILNQSSDREQSYEIEPQQDLSDIIKHYKKSHFMDKNIKKDSKTIKSVDITDNNDSEDSEGSENEKTLIDFNLEKNNKEKEEKIPEQTQKRLSQIKNLDLAGDEVTSESEDEVEKDSIKYILPDKKSDSEDEESEESKIETTPIVFQSKKRDNEEKEEEEKVYEQTQIRISQLKKLDLAGDEESSESEDEVKKDLPLKYILPDKMNDSAESEESEIEATPVVFQFKKRDNEEEENENDEEKIPDQTQKRFSEIKKLDLAGDEETSESEDEVKKDQPVKYILPDKKSESEELEESEIEATPVAFWSKKCKNVEEGHLSVHAERRLAEMKRIDFANYEDSDDSEEEKNSLPIKNINIKGKNSRQQELDDSSDSEEENIKKHSKSTQNASIKNNDIEASDSDESKKADAKKDSKSVEQNIIKNQDSDSKEKDKISNDTLKHLSQMKKIDLANSDFISDDEEIKLKNAGIELDTISSQAIQHLQQMKRLSFDNDDEDSSDSNDQKFKIHNDIDIEEHKVTMPEGYQDLKLSKLIEEDSFCDSSIENTKSKTEKISKSKKKYKLIRKEAVGASQEIDMAHCSSENESFKNEKIIYKKSNINENDQDVDINKESDEESDAKEHRKILTQVNKINVKLSSNKDDSDSDRSMSPSTTHRLSQFKKMNLIDKDNSSSSSEDENKRNEVLPKTVESHSFKSDDSDEEKSEKSFESNVSTTDDSKKSVKTYPENDKQKKKVSDEDKFINNKNVIISKIQETADTEENDVESQELFSSMEDLTGRRNKESVLESNEQKTANKVSATPELTDIIRERITNISQLVEKENLLPVTYESTMASNHVSPDEEIFLLEVPRNVFSDNLIGEQFSFFKTTLKVGCNSYEAFKRKVAPTISCVFQSEDHGENSYETINIRPVVSIVTRRKKLVDESNKPSNQEKQTVEDNRTKLESAVSDPSGSKKKKVKTKDTIDSKKIKTPRKVILPDITIESDRKKKTPREEDVAISPTKTKKSEKKFSVDSPASKKENLKGSAKKGKKLDVTINKENVTESPMEIKKKEKKSKETSLIGSSNETNKKVKNSTNEKSKKNKFNISRFIMSPSKLVNIKEKKVKHAKVEQCKGTTLKRKSSELHDNDDTVDDKNNASLSPPLKKQKIPIRNTTINANEEDEEQLKLAVKSKSKSKIQEINGKVKTENKFKVTKSKKTVAESNDAFVEASMSSSTSKIETVNKPAKVESKKSPKTRKFDTQPSDDLSIVEKPVKKKKPNLAGENKPKRITKAAKAKMQMESADMKNTLFSLFQKTMKCDSMKLFSTSSSNLEKGKYSPLELEYTSNKKTRLDMMSSSSDEDDNNINMSFKMREKPKAELDEASSNSSCDFIPSSQNAFKSEETKKSKIFFNE